MLIYRVRIRTRSTCIYTAYTKNFVYWNLYLKKVDIFMMTNEKLRPYIFGFLAFCVLSSKHIIIYNEEILVALTFFAFVYFVYRYFGQTIQESLDERSQGIQQELESFSVLKKTALEELLQEHSKVGLLSGALQSLTAFTAAQVQNACVTGNKTLQSVIAQDMSKKLSTLAQASGPLQLEWQTRMAQSQVARVLLKLQKSKQGSSWNRALLRQALTRLQNS